MAKSPQQWAANNRQIAAVLGLKPKPKQLVEIGAWITQARSAERGVRSIWSEFPKKTAKGYAVLELKEWHLQFLKAESRKPKAEKGKGAPAADTRAADFGEGKMSRGDKSHGGGKGGDKSQHSKTGDLPPQANAPKEGEELFADMATGLDASLDLWEKKLKNPELWTEAPLQLWQMKQLEKHRPWLFKADAPALSTDEVNAEVFPEYASLKLLCDLYKRRWPHHNINVYKQRIMQWQAGGGLPSAAPFHPTPGVNSQYRVRQCFEWFEKWILPKYKIARTPELPGVPESEPAIDLISLREREERDQITHNQWERAKERGDYVHKTVALATGVAAVKRIHLLVKTEDERNLPKMRREKLAGLGVAPEIVAAFGAWDVELARSVTDRRETEMQAIAVVLPKAEVATELKGAS